FAVGQDRLHPQDLLDARVCETAPYSGILQHPCDGTPGWFTLNLRGGINFNKRLGLFLALSNLSDTNYRNHGSGFDAPGFDARLSLIVDF
ncbi:MAG: hypothetical protein JRJ87_13205, partial [Deltaproteobacteria bacterium]|nr:hypothetical protein [Deltaproteobacteria bacterium]